MRWALAIVVALVAPPAAATSRTPSTEGTIAPERVPAEPLAPTALTPEMRDWLDRSVNRLGTDDERLQRILWALEARDMVYDNAVTGTARDAFETRRFNCLSLAHLVVGFARELGIDATYVRIEEFRSFHQRGDLVIVSTHVAAGWGPPANTRIVEFEQTTDRERRAAYRISDNEALALHYANRGAELVRAGWTALGRDWLRQAVAIDPDCAEAWVNLGVAERRLGAPDRAEAAYRTALDRDPENLSAWRNLASLLQLRGDTDAARTVLELLDRPGTRNPYTFLALGDLSASSGAHADAARFYRRATQLDPRHPQILAARGELALAEGDRAAAAHWLLRAQRRGADEPRVVRLAAALAGP